MSTPISEAALSQAEFARLTGRTKYMIWANMDVFEKFPALDGVSPKIRHTAENIEKAKNLAKDMGRPKQAKNRLKWFLEHEDGRGVLTMFSKLSGCDPEKCQLWLQRDLPETDPDEPKLAESYPELRASFKV